MPLEAVPFFTLHFMCKCPFQVLNCSKSFERMLPRNVSMLPPVPPLHRMVGQRAGNENLDLRTSL